MTTQNTLRGLLCSILCVAYATQRRGSHARLHPVQASLRSLLTKLDQDPIATTDAPGVLPDVLLRGQEMLAALATRQLLRRLAEGAHPQVVGPGWLVARQLRHEGRDPPRGRPAFSFGRPPDRRGCRDGRGLRPSELSGRRRPLERVSGIGSSAHSLHRGRVADDVRPRSEARLGLYGHRLELYRRTQPQAVFGTLGKWAARMRRGAFVFTSNVDGQFQKAGFDPESIHECHGSIHWLQCQNGCSPDIWSADGLNVDVDAAKCEWQAPLPSCPRCGSVFRPNLLMFGDGAWLSRRHDQQQRRLQA